MAVSARDIAERAHCSIAAVSLVMNDRWQGRVSTALRDRILAIADELGYTVNRSARALVTGRSRAIGLICPDVRNPFYGKLFHGALDVLEPDYELTLFTGHHGHDYDHDTVKNATAEDVAGMILAHPSPEVLRRVVPDRPTVLIDSSGIPFESVRIDFGLERSCRELAEHLASLGHRTIGYIDFETQKDTFATRTALVTTFLAELGCRLSTPAVARDLTLQAGEQAFDESWDFWRADGVTAIICALDVLALGAIKAARNRELSIPADLSVASFDDQDFAAFVEPPLTTVRFDGEQMGRLAGAKMLDLLRGVQPAGEKIESVFIPRGSTEVLRA